MKKRNIRMIGLDLDGTLLNDKKEISEHTRAVIREAQSRGVIVLPATGRPVAGIPQVVMELPGIRYAVTANGARVMDVKENRVLHEALLPYEKGRQVLEILGRYDSYREIYHAGEGYTEEAMLARLEKYLPVPPLVEYIQSTRIRVDNVDEFLCREQIAADKLQAIFRDMEEKKAAEQALLRQVPEIAVTSGISNNIEVNDVCAGKGNALLKLGDILGISAEEIMACGDGGNDLDMIQKAGLSVAMANAEEAIKEAADYVTDTNEADGVARAIERFVLS